MSLPTSQSCNNIDTNQQRLNIITHFGYINISRKESNIGRLDHNSIIRENMKRNRQAKIVAILSLCVSVVGLTLGFAAFSNTLTISSSTTVSPDESDFKLVLYGLPGGNYDEIDEYDPNSLKP